VSPPPEASVTTRRWVILLVAIVVAVSALTFVSTTMLPQRLTIASGHWYLLEPPVDQDFSRVLFDFPLGRWYHKGSYDSAAECARAREIIIDKATRAFQALKNERMAGVFAASADGSRCIASDDPRLK